MNCYTVSQLGIIAKSALNETFKEDTWVTGEIHGYKMHDRSGHVYFDLVEKDILDPSRYIAKIGCAFFKNSFLSWRTKLRREGFSAFQLADGLEIKLRADVDLYVKEGRYQLIVSEIDAGFTLGAIAKKRQQTIDELKKEGLFDKNRQLGIIDCPFRIGLITSVGSAAYNDFLSVLNASGYAFKLTIYNSYMQGEQTACDVSTGIRALEHKDIDVIAIVRGGGAKTDLFYFDDPMICQAIARCRLPVLTGIGHEIDLSVADMVAFRNFVTPTDAAYFLTVELDAFRQRVENALSIVKKLPDLSLSRAEENLKMLGYRFTTSVSMIMAASYTNINTAAHNLIMSASRSVSHYDKRLLQLAALLKPATLTMANAAKVKLDELAKLVQTLEPSLTLKRGFSITLGPDNKPLLTSKGAVPGDRLKTILYSGSLSSIVDSKELS
jgi:exodeoxyribonuclease VII large subunit